jgi:hypothetical protein
MQKGLRVIAAVVATVVLGAVSGTAFADPPGGPHTPVTICHKPGTPAEHTLVVDDDAVPGHLGHGDTLGPCAAVVPPLGPPGVVTPGEALQPTQRAAVPQAGVAAAVVAQPRTTG